MCGVGGVWVFGGASEGRLHAQARAMADTLAHRGPDGEGVWVDADAGVALAHRRLAIVDLSPTGHQPMASADGRIVITYNGELYNRAELAAELAMPFRGTSDTEVLVEAIARFGIEGALERTNGMFAFAAFDRATRTLHLARDRLGIKPLYYTRQGTVFAFASELRPLRALPDLTFPLDLSAVAALLAYGCVPAPRTIYATVRKLAPGERLKASVQGLQRERYWDVAAVAMDGQRRARAQPMDQIDEEFEALLTDAVRRQMVSDVPLGAFLSGGVDSSTVVALMQRAANRPVKTFSVGFYETAFNEADHARAVASHLGTDHTELVLSAKEALALVPRLPEIYDEPFADSSQLPTLLVSQLARRHVTVALSGDGGDEVFGGYTRYQAVPRLWGVLAAVPRSVRRGVRRLLECTRAEFWDALATPVPRRLKPAHFGDRLLKGVRLLDAEDPLDMYRRLTLQWPDPELVVGCRFESCRPASADGNRLWAAPLCEEAETGYGAAGGEGEDGWNPFAPVGCRDDLDVVARLRLLDMCGYLPDDILTKVDRASMAVGLEVRVPLLDHRVVEFAWRLPADQLISRGQGKRPLRAVLARYVPPELTERPKKGFGVPIAEWLRGPLREWAEDLLSPVALAADGIFAPGPIRARWREHLSGRRNWHYALWPVLQFQAWRRSRV